MSTTNNNNDTDTTEETLDSLTRSSTPPSSSPSLSAERRRMMQERMAAAAAATAKRNNNNNQDASSETQTMQTLVVENERHNESTYRNMYRSLLEKHRGLFLSNQTVDAGNDDNSNNNINISSDLNHYQEETSILRSTMISERNSWIMGGTMGLAAFLSLRYLPRYYVYRYGRGESQKWQKLLDAEAIAKENNTYWAQRSFSTLIEAIISLFVANRAYQMASSTTEGTYERIAAVPLVPGRSIIADHICPEWVVLTKQTIPLGFWDHVDEGTVHDVRTWNAIRTFSQNCIKRKLYERVIQKQQQEEQQQQEGEENHVHDENSADGRTPVVLPNPVPDYIMSAAQDLTTEQIILLVTDQSQK